MAQSRRIAWLRRDGTSLGIDHPRHDEDGAVRESPQRVPRQRVDAEGLTSGGAESERAAALTLVARERERVARDLHEIIMARLLRLGFDLSALEERVEAPVAARIRTMVAEIDEVWGDTRRLAFDLLSSHTLGEGLVERLQTIVQDAAARVGCAPSLHVSGPVDALADDVSHELVAVTKEAVLNVLLHAQASHFGVELEVGSGTIELRVLDDGVGVAETQARGLGLRNLAARAADLDGTFAITLAEDGGTLVRWTVPVLAPA